MAFPLKRVLDPITEPISLTAMKNYLRVDMDDDDTLIQEIISSARERAEDLTARCLIAQQWQFCLDQFPCYLTSNIGYFGHNRYSHTHRRDHAAIILPRGPVVSIDSITYIDASGTTQLLDPSFYNADLISEPARILPSYGNSWPVTLYDINVVTILFTAGYEQKAAEPAVPTGAPGAGTVTLSRAAKALRLLSVLDAGTPVLGCTMTAGVVTVPDSVIGHSLVITYVVNSIPLSFIQAIKLFSGSYYENREEVAQGGGNFNVLPAPVSAMSLLSTYELFPVGYPRS